MAHPVIEHAHASLAEVGFAVSRVSGEPELPGEQLLVRISDDEQGNERQLLITLYDGLGDHLHDAYLLQYFTRFQFLVPPERRDDLARLLVNVNARLPDGAFGFLADGMVFFRAMAFLTTEVSTWPKVVSEYVYMTAFALNSFAEGIEAVASGARSAREVTVTDPRLEPIE